MKYLLVILLTYTNKCGVQYKTESIATFKTEALCRQQGRDMLKDVKGCQMSFESWLGVYADDYVLSLPKQYQYDMYLDFITGG